MEAIDRGPAIEIVLVEDEGLFRDLLRIVLSSQQRLQVTGSFADAASALESIPALRPAVVLLDIEMPGGMNGVQLGLMLRRHLPKLGIVLLSNNREPHLLSSLPPESIGGWSYILKKSVDDVDALVRAIEGAAAGFLVLDPQLISGLPGQVSGALASLTPRQREILGLVAQGLTNGAIARRLSLAEKSVENQMNQIYQHVATEGGDTSLHPRVGAVLAYLRTQGG